MKLLLFAVMSILVISCENSVKLVKDYYEDGSLKSVCETKNGLKYGKLKEYFHNGNIKEQSNWINDTISGLSIKYYESGIIESTSMWLNGIQIGNFVKYDEAGNLVQTKTYKDNMQCGYDIRYHKGMMFQTRHYITVLDSTYLNQYIVYDGEGNICYNESIFYSIYYYGKSDTLEINEEANILVEYETPRDVSQLKFVMGGMNKFFYLLSEQKVDTFIVDDGIIRLNDIMDSPGISRMGGIILCPFLDYDNNIIYQKMYFYKQFYVRK